MRYAVNGLQLLTLGTDTDLVLSGLLQESLDSTDWELQTGSSGVRLRSEATVFGTGFSFTTFSLTRHC